LLYICNYCWRNILPLTPLFYNQLPYRISKLGVLCNLYSVHALGTQVPMCDVHNLWQMGISFSMFPSKILNEKFKVGYKIGDGNAAIFF